MPLDNYGFSRRFGWCSDRFGVSAIEPARDVLGGDSDSEITRRCSGPSRGHAPAKLHIVDTPFPIGIRTT